MVGDEALWLSGFPIHGWLEVVSGVGENGGVTGRDDFRDRENLISGWNKRGQCETRWGVARSWTQYPLNLPIKLVSLRPFRMESMLRGIFVILESTSIFQGSSKELCLIYSDLKFQKEFHWKYSKYKSCSEKGGSSVNLHFDLFRAPSFPTVLNQWGVILCVTLSFY